MTIKHQAIWVTQSNHWMTWPCSQELMLQLREQKRQTVSDGTRARGGQHLCCLGGQSRLPEVLGQGSSWALKGMMRGSARHCRQGWGWKVGPNSQIPGDKIKVYLRLHKIEVQQLFLRIWWNFWILDTEYFPHNFRRLIDFQTPKKMFCFSKLYSVSSLESHFPL